MTSSIKELNYSDLKEEWCQASTVVTLVYTPTCGTCQLAKRMLAVIQEMCQSVIFEQINLNINEQLAIDFEILSVPCLLIHKNSQCEAKIYNFESVPYLYETINSYA